jgi:hypothetical protein
LDAIVAKCEAVPGPETCSRSAIGEDAQVAYSGGVRIYRFAWLRDLMDQAAKPKPAATQHPEKAVQGQNNADAEKSNTPAKAATEKTATGPGAKEKAASDSAKKDAAGDEDDADDDTLAATAGPEETAFKPATLPERLAAARERLAAEAAMAEALASGTAAESGTSPAGYSRERKALDQILAAKEYRRTATGPSVRDRVLERIARWINRTIGKVVQAGYNSEWAGRTAEIVFVVGLCVALVWFLIRMERKGRLGTAFTGSGPAAAAASARDWQLWLKDARAAAEAGAWREAIRLVYWASISRMESGGMWPADRARTPREYLSLLGPEHQQRSDLSALTRSFERTWYAGRAAGETDFRQAEQIAGRLGAQ